MELIQIRRRLLQPHIKTISSIPVYVDNACYVGAGKINQYTSDENWFLGGIFDTGNTETKLYTYHTYPASIDSRYITLLTYNDLNGKYIDYWGIKNDTGAGTHNIPGRYIVFSVYKPDAANSFMYDNTHGMYLFKGKNVKTIGGLPVLYDNAYYNGSNGDIKTYQTDNRFFITFAFETSSTESKSYTMRQFIKSQHDINFNAYSRWFNDIESTSADYWGMTTESATTRTINSVGRYIVASVVKADAANFYIYDNTNQRYICKGDNVS